MNLAALKQGFQAVATEITNPKQPCLSGPVAEVANDQSSPRLVASRFYPVMSRFVVLASMVIATVIGVNPSLAQEQQNPSTRTTRIAPNGNSLRTDNYSQQFREGFLKGCLNGKTSGVKDQPGYCNCLANAYQARYDGQTLALISQLANRGGAIGPNLVNVMMKPETQRCALSH